VKIPVEVIDSPDDLLERVPELSADYDYLIVDGPASLSEATRAILFRSDLAFIPVQPTGVDLRSASDAMRLVKQAIADTSGQSATVWELPGRPASESASEYEELFKELFKHLP
jgi:chromosome partitioning protein